MPIVAAIKGSPRGSGGNRPAAYPSRSPNAEKTIRSGRPAAINSRRISAARGTSSRRFLLIEVIRSSDRRDCPAMMSRKSSAGRRGIAIADAPVLRQAAGKAVYLVGGLAQHRRIRDRALDRL